MRWRAISGTPRLATCRTELLRRVEPVVPAGRHRILRIVFEGCPGIADCRCIDALRVNRRSQLVVVDIADARQVEAVFGEGGGIILLDPAKFGIPFSTGSGVRKEQTLVTIGVYRPTSRILGQNRSGCLRVAVKFAGHVEGDGGHIPV